MSSKRKAPIGVRLTKENERRIAVVMDVFKLDNRNKTINFLLDRAWEVWFKRREDKKRELKELLKAWEIGARELIP